MRSRTWSGSPAMALRAFLLSTRLYSVLVPVLGPLFFDLYLGVFPRDQLVFPTFEFCFCLIVSLSREYVFQFLQLFDQALVFLDGQEDAYVLAILVHHVLSTHLLTSSLGCRSSRDFPLV